MSLGVRRFRRDEAGVLAAIRMEALANAPCAFAERLEVARAVGGEDFEQALSAGEVWGAFVGDRCVAMAGLQRHTGANVAHKATLWGVYVSPTARGQAVGQGLLQAMIDHAGRVGIEVLELGVGDFNVEARRLYGRMGFVSYGLELRALKLDGRYIDEVLMALHL